MNSDHDNANADKPLHVFDSRLANRDIALDLIRRAHQQIRIFTPDLEKSIYDHTDVIEAINMLALRSKQTQIRVLVKDSGPAVKSGHRLIELCRKHTSSLFLHQTPADTEQIEAAYLIIDDSAYLYKKNGSLFNGYYSEDDKLKARELCKRFDEAWARSQPDAEMRRLFI